MIDYSKIYYNNETDQLDVDLPLLDHPTKEGSKVLIDNDQKTPFVWYRAGVWVMSQTDYDKLFEIPAV